MNQTVELYERPKNNTVDENYFSLVMPKFLITR